LLLHQRILALRPLHRPDFWPPGITVICDLSPAPAVRQGTRRDLIREVDGNFRAYNLFQPRTRGDLEHTGLPESQVVFSRTCSPFARHPVFIYVLWRSSNAGGTSNRSSGILCGPLR